MFRKRGGRLSSYYTAKNISIGGKQVTLISAAKK